MNYSDLLLFLLERSSLSSVELVERLKIDVQTLQKLIQQLGDKILVFGQADNPSFALKRQIRGYANFPIFEVSLEGNSTQRIGDLIPVQPFGYVTRWEEGHRLGQSSYSSGLPWWLYDQRPQGFIGRSFAQSYADILKLNKDFTLWTDDEVLIAISHAPIDNIGNLVLYRGDRAIGTAAMTLPASWTIRDDGFYPCLAQSALDLEYSQSSTGGMQPKFLAYVEGPEPKHVIVKFTAPDNNAVTQRWGSLLQAEYLASEILKQAGLASANSRFLTKGQQWFLEVQRFDRLSSRGRIGIVSLAALDHEFIGDTELSWSEQGKQLYELGLITFEDWVAMQKLQAFGHMIGNTDMHLGNLSFFHNQTTHLKLAPVYDMLPMQFAPTVGGHLPNQGRPIKITPMPEIQYWREMYPWALKYWETLTTLTQPDAGFVPLIFNQLEHLKGLRSIL